MHRKFKKGQLICSEGSSGEEMFIILSGSVSVYKMINAEKISFSRLGSNDFIGEIGLLLGGERTASVEALENTEVLVVNRQSLEKKIQEDPAFALRMLTVMARRITEGHFVISSLQGMKRSLEIMHKV